MSSFNVKLKIYDLSRGMVKLWSPFLIGKQINGVWHTAVWVYDMEYFYGGGIMCLAPSEFESYYDIQPVNVVDMGITELQQSHFHEYLNGIQPNFTEDKYNLVNWNCNNFTNEICNFLVGKNIPQYILDTPKEVMSTTKGKLILDMMQSYQTNIAPGFETNSSLLNNGSNEESKGANNRATCSKEPEVNELPKVPSVSLDNFFNENKIENLLDEYIKNEKYDVNEKKDFLSFLKNLLDNVSTNPDILKNRYVHVTNFPKFQNEDGSSEYNKILSSLNFFQGYIENDEINNLQKFTIFVDPKYNKMHAFTEHLDLFLNKNVFLKNPDKAIFKMETLNFKDMCEYAAYRDKKKSNSNDVLIFISEAFLTNHFDVTNEKNDLSHFNKVKAGICADPKVEREFLSSTSDLLEGRINELHSSE
ncbi:conserved protein, unknown function [Plasmodium knowlesi strain H]|uniref:PPPDE domain-containing protein n=3 Tax=Plasmodium knowlesi TaxID=5850 RepID=A0A5K1UQB9_PLAKH|nr:PPPDE peptidase domain-containing protein, putative [Plasmodium knowlesi strain H]OTN63940.1 putative Permuted Papain fold Peptidase [Plasmodium knowlesi]CAA9990971.1 PPPDE peptidase domain-containing protein, putative [Plasmodium knowlesi strain H]SBO20787.1 conserved protein, unknown function [Plasmodium knowlesi strain H]SBO21228.1 conserved protein, unknown function [Plasmodium knowlesi strain H]VVS80445.1 PPPDE peptidase domain-containing protein, putative [Plasmodium knowlesi strain H|eukprot:XP_002262254.1 Permuted Papain fold Peptidase, putative [Plasmodium knowlesi strain H]